MILDTSAIVAILEGEPAAEALALQFRTFPTASIGTPTLLECGIVLNARDGISGRTLLRSFLAENEVTVVSFVEEHAWIAVEAFHRFGKGRHPAALNFGDCMTYAVAKVLDAPILCLGEDFAKTDIAVVDWRATLSD